MTLKFVIILQNVIKAYHRKSGKSKYDRKLTELDVETPRIRSCVNGVLINKLAKHFENYTKMGINCIWFVVVWSEQRLLITH